ncbi:hypothetical protein [Mycobacterium riyadhense]|uniref:Uncharacterized protein n=1 Tax=Mycobacterium riyadhense TaxID=486698 RepID=A0A1X2BIN6_9MYCO|nr:hypothetical protein [Mycobacterium riyadhense]MCV7148053.1 hypothetical protein [Mycobacterium riyadhense]ORW63540.1 hypothetical protein AWC22_00490 [Mycobacterium riyadhense]VTO96526.1 hypothetical protein BIN_B_01593 [Mycobacterium riyadhense]
MTETDQRELNCLRRELLNRLDRLPMENWSCLLLRAVIGVFDLQFGEPPPEPRPDVRLHIVK